MITIKCEHAYWTALHSEEYIYTRQLVAAFVCQEMKLKGYSGVAKPIVSRESSQE
jgi:hypothetical protein